MYAQSNDFTDQNAIDLRSDTVTRPSRAMREMMANAAVGDDVYGDDPTVRELEERVADLLGKQAGLFVTSGTQSNLLAMLGHCGRGEEVISGVDYHALRYEAGGASVLGGIATCPLPLNEKNGLTAEAVKAAVKIDDLHFPITKLVSLENTVYGQVQDQATITEIASVAHEAGLGVHLDGARLMNAAVKSNATAAELVKDMDTVSLCLSKGLGAPVGSVLVGPSDFIERARRNRKMLGGGLRQSGLLAACGLYALDHNVERLAEDHHRAALLADRLSAFDAITVHYDKLDTNMVFISVLTDHLQPLYDHMKKNGIIFGTPDKPMRLVVHLDIDDAALERIGVVLTDYFKS